MFANCVTRTVFENVKVIQERESVTSNGWKVRQKGTQDARARWPCNKMPLASYFCHFQVFTLLNNVPANSLLNTLLCLSGHSFSTCWAQALGKRCAHRWIEQACVLLLWSSLPRGGRQSGGEVNWNEFLAVGSVVSMAMLIYVLIHFVRGPRWRVVPSPRAPDNPHQCLVLLFKSVPIW